MKLSIIPALNSKLSENVSRHHEDHRGALEKRKAKIEGEIKEMSAERDHLTREIEQLQVFLEKVHQQIEDLEPRMGPPVGSPMPGPGM